MIKTFIGSTIILMITGLIVRVLGFIYRIYLSNLIGAEGMGLYQLIFPLYSLIILTLTSGISVAVSKMTAASSESARDITSCAFKLITLTGVVISGLCFLFIDFLVNNILNDQRTYLSVLVLVFCIPLVAAASAFKGYFYGLTRIVPTAISQTIEQVVKISFVMASAGWILKAGLEYACAIATLGTALGEIANLLSLYLIFIFKKDIIKIKHPLVELDRKQSIYKEIVFTSVPISFNRFIVSMMSTVEAMLIPTRLLVWGLSHQQSMELFGKLMGMAMPIIFFPSIVTSSLATMLVPSISEGISSRSFKSVNYKISKSIQVTITIGVIFTALFIAFPDQISHAIYKKDNVGDLLLLLSSTCIFFYLQQTLLGILNGLGKQVISLRNSVIGNIIRIGFVWFCIPVSGLNGYVLGIIISSILVCLLNIYSILKATGMILDLRMWVLKPIFIGCVMLFSCKYIYSFFSIFNIGLGWVLVLTLIWYFIMGSTIMMVLGVVNISTFFVKKIPKGKRLAFIDKI